MASQLLPGSRHHVLVVESQDEAIQIAIGHLRNPSWDPAVVKVEDAGDAWRVFYNSRLYVETGEVSHALAGNLPLLIEKSSGGVTRDLTYVPGIDRWSDT
jgi:hypothetical protein